MRGAATLVYKYIVITYSVQGTSIVNTSSRESFFNNITIGSYLLVDDSFQGMVAGYTLGEFSPPGTNVIDKFPFATNANATDVGDLTQSRYTCAGQQD